jgi:nucleoside-diphosphate-sugar epimerase
MRVLVTGASGFLGGAVARGLIAAGHGVTVLQRRPSGLPCREVRGDIVDVQAVAEAMQDIEAVIHLAAKVAVTGAHSEYTRINVTGTATVLESARAAGVARFVHVSSPSVAHAGSPLVGAGAGPANPITAHGSYSRTKAESELIALAADRPGFAVVAVRPHLVWGPGDEQLVGRIVARARAGRLFLIDGGVALIDTTYIDNAVTALIASMEHAQEALVHGRAFVISNGQPRTVAELLTRMAVSAGAPAPTRSVPFRLAWLAGSVAERAWRVHPRGERAGDPPMTAFLAEQLATAHWFDQRATKRALDWAPTIGLDEGFDRLASWYRSESSA